MDKAEIVIYKESDNPAFQIEVRVEDETIWLTQTQIVSLFASSKANVSEHIKHIFLSKELEPDATVRKFRTVQIEGNRKVQRNIDYYNLDMIISIGYRVNSIRGTQFRIWANKVLKEYLLKGHAISHRLEKVENDVFHIKEKVDSIEFQINTNLPHSTTPTLQNSTTPKLQHSKTPKPLHHSNTPPLQNSKTPKLKFRPRRTGSQIL
jgi:hypothetical protein